ncbi:MAG: cytoplasmic protein [Thermoplasmata archaeon]|nr:cytoplasmic protein [Thermoplasmata archaeon]
MTLDAAVVAPEHYQVVLENEKVRVLKISYRPFESGAMHSHPDSVVVFLTEMNAYMNYPDGRSEDMVVPAGAAAWVPASTHQPGQKGANRFEAFMIELK